MKRELSYLIMLAILFMLGAFAVFLGIEARNQFSQTDPNQLELSQIRFIRVERGLNELNQGKIVGSWLFFMGDMNKPNEAFDFNESYPYYPYDLEARILGVSESNQL